MALPLDCITRSRRSLEARFEIMQMRRHSRRDVGVHDRGRKPLELAIFGEDAMRYRHWATERFQRARQSRPRFSDSRTNEAGKRRRPQRRYLRATFAMRESSSRVSGLAIVPSNRVRSSTPKRIARATSGCGREGDSAYSSRAILPADFDEVLEARVGEKRDARALELEQRVGGDGRAVGDHRGFRAAEHLREALDDRARRIIGRRERFVNDQLAVDHRDEIREGAAGIDARNNRGPSVLHETFSRTLKFDDLAASSSA